MLLRLLLRLPPRFLRRLLRGISSIFPVVLLRLHSSSRSFVRCSHCILPASFLASAQRSASSPMLPASVLSTTSSDGAGEAGDGACGCACATLPCTCAISTPPSCELRDRDAMNSLKQHRNKHETSTLIRTKAGNRKGFEFRDLAEFSDSQIAKHLSPSADSLIGLCGRLGLEYTVTHSQLGLLENLQRGTDPPSRRPPH